MTAIVEAVTGWKTSAYEFLRWGERRNHLMRVYNLREGFSADDDSLPDRFFSESVPTRHSSAASLSRERFNDAVRTYYGMMGWDEDGKPRESTLVDFELESLVDAM
jgi:aldehyde:ferredoxin oxidoreductase